MRDPTIQTRRALRNIATEIIGEIVDGWSTGAKWSAAREVIKLDILVARGSREELAANLALLIYRLERPSACFPAKLLRETPLYSAEGILFPALVQLIREEDNFFGCLGWLPEQVRALGLAMNPGDGLVGRSSSDSYTLQDKKGHQRDFYRVF
jgi:hypothetical protein